MPHLVIATPKAVDANSNLTIARADQIIRARLYTEDWETAAGIDTAVNYLINGTKAIGSTSIDIDGGNGALAIGGKITIGADTTVYSITSAIANQAATQAVTIDPPLVAEATDDAAVTRQTFSKQGKAVVTATSLLDTMMDFFGAPRTIDQALANPRSGLVDLNGNNIDFDTIAPVLEEGTALLAEWVLQRNLLDTPALQGIGVKSAKLGPLAVEAALGSEGTEEVIPDWICAILAPIASPKPIAFRGGGVVPLIRG